MPTAYLTAMKGPTITVPCPTCGVAASCSSIRTGSGIVLTEPIVGVELVQHATCDIWALASALSRAAIAASQIRVHVPDLDDPR